MEESIKGDTPMKLELPASHVKFLINVLEAVSLPRKDTDPVYGTIMQQYNEQFKLAVVKPDAKKKAN